MRIIYISLTGNAKHFVKNLTKYLDETYHIKVDGLNVKDLNHETFKVEDDFFCIIPTYLEGGNGVDNGDVEILTTPLREFIASHDNHEHLLGIIGNGNKNFGHQYCLTAKQYSEQFSKPVIDDFELRGTPADVSRIGDKLAKFV